VLLLSLLFSETSGGTGSRLLLLGMFVVLAVLTVLALTRLERSARLEAVLVRLQDTTAEIRVRFAVLLLVAFVAVAGRLGLETILGAFLAGAILGLVDRDTVTHPNFHLKLEAIGYGFVIPVFFVSSGLRFDLRALLDSPSAIARVPLFLVALLVVRGVPAALYASTVGRRQAVAAGLLQATSLPFLVTATAIGVTLGEITAVTGAALVSAGLLSVVVFPLLAVTLLRADAPDVVAPRSVGQD
jgi:Kef-type K+ transport system membrane component KefB